MSRNHIDTSSPINVQDSGSKTVDNVGMWGLGRQTTTTLPPTWVFSSQLSVNPTATYNSLQAGKHKQTLEGHDEKRLAVLELDQDRPSLLQQLPLERLFSVLQRSRIKRG